MQRKTIATMAFEDLSFGFEGRTPLFENITIEMPKSQAVWVRSPGGRGKSSLLKILSGLTQPIAGRYLINGECVGDMTFEEFLPYRMAIGYGFDMGGLMTNMTIFDNLMLPLRYHKLAPEDEAQERVQKLIERFGMSQARDLRPYWIPGSQRKLSCILRAFIHQPEVVFLDEPATGLKAENLNELIDFVEESFKKHGLKQLFFTSENPRLAQAFKAEELLISCDWFTSRMVG